MVKVMLGMAVFPVVWRSDNAKEFVAEVVAEMNQMLEFKHVTGAAYHPQSQGMVESMHETVNHIVRGLDEGHSDDWERRIPFCESILMMVPLASLGGRSPYEVVTGLKPRMPAALTPGHPVQYLEINEYVGRLQQYFQELTRRYKLSSVRELRLKSLVEKVV